MAYTTYRRSQLHIFNHLDGQEMVQVQGILLLMVTLICSPMLVCGFEKMDRAPRLLTDSSRSWESGNHELAWDSTGTRRRYQTSY